MRATLDVTIAKPGPVPEQTVLLADRMRVQLDRVDRLIEDFLILSGALLWALLAGEATARRRTWTGLLGFAAIEAAVFVRYTDIVVLGCAVLAVLATRWRRPASVPPGAAVWWLGSVAVFGAGVAAFDDLVYGGPLKSGYQPGEITFSLGAVGPNLRNMPAHLIQAMPVTLLGLLGLACIAARWAQVRWAGRQRGAGEQARAAGPDPAAGLALATSWLSVWGLYAAYAWTTAPDLSTLSSVRFYLPAIGAIALVGAWPLARLPLRAPLAAVTATAVVAAMFGLGIWSYTSMRTCPFTAVCASHLSQEFKPRSWQLAQHETVTGSA